MRMLKPRSVDLTEVEKTYIAGFFDGEGTITLSCQKTKRGYYHLVPQVQISNCNKESLDWVANRLPNAGVYKGKHVDKRSKNYKPQYRLCLTTYPTIIGFLKAILPYLRIKKQQAELMIKLAELRMKRHKKYGYHAHTTGEELEIYRKIKELNKRGTG